VSAQSDFFKGIQHFNMTKKNTILNAATILFAEKGFKDTSMSELSKATGAAEGTIFYHFKNKEELFISILANLKQEIFGEFDRHLKEEEYHTGLEMMLGAISWFIELAGAMENRFLILHRHDAYELAKENKVCREHLEAIYDCLVDIFERAIRIGQNDGSIGEMSPRNTALIVLAMVDGLVRLNTYGLYHAGALYSELMVTARRMLDKAEC
jgi:AcrR family transcriptional regulator